MPAVSVVLNTHNSSRYLRETLDSLLSQDFEDWEAIVWDNASTDDTEVIVKSVADTRLTFHHDPNKVSLYQSRINALQECRGAVVAFLDHDDTWTPNKLSVQLGVFDDPSVVASSTDFWLVTTKGKLSSADPSARLFRTYPTRLNSRLELSRHYRVAMSTLMVRTSTMRSSLPAVAPDLTVIEDFDMVFRLMEHGGLTPINEPLMLYRLHDSNYSSNSDAHRIEVDEWIRHYEPLPSEVDAQSQIIAAVRDNYLRAAARRALLSGRRSEALTLTRAMTWGPDRAKLTAGLVLPRTILRRM